MRSGIRVGDTMVVQPASVAREMLIRDVAVEMERQNTNVVLVKDGSELLGIVTEWDFVRRAVLEGCNVNTTPVHMMMTKDLVTVSPGMDVLDAMRLMKEADIDHMPVVDGEKLLGLVSIKDILCVQPSLYESFVNNYEFKDPYKRRTSVIDIEEFERLL